MDNRTIAQQLMHRARYLGDQHASLYRVRAYRRAAETILGLDEPLETIVDQQGRRGLRQLPGIGDHIARALETLVRTGTLPETGEVSVPTKPQDERGDSWGSGVTECSACGTSSR
jgi:DNA polymerase (family 10)